MNGWFLLGLALMSPLLWSFTCFMFGYLAAFNVPWLSRWTDKRKKAQAALPDGDPVSVALAAAQRLDKVQRLKFLLALRRAGIAVPIMAVAGKEVKFH